LVVAVVVMMLWWFRGRRMEASAAWVEGVMGDRTGHWGAAWVVWMRKT
jgi:hypothetical protein